MRREQTFDYAVSIGSVAVEFVAKSKSKCNCDVVFARQGKGMKADRVQVRW
jgi:hypothetical protein